MEHDKSTDTGIDADADARKNALFRAETSHGVNFAPEAFERIAAEEFNRIPERFAKRITNCALLIAEEPDESVRREEDLGPGETLLGLYHGVPATERGDFYSGVLPDTITLFRLPLQDEAQALLEEGKAADEESALRLAIKETLWHEIGHHFGMSEAEVHEREEEGSNEFEK